MAGITGYTHPSYAESLAEFGEPRYLPHCKGWLLERQIPGTNYRDAMGCYPLFSCQDWSKLHLDIAELGSDLVSLSMVPEVFGAFDQGYLKKCFGVVVPFKRHFVCDLSQPLIDTVSRHHRRYARRALDLVQCKSHPNPPEFLDEWFNLHKSLVLRHEINGIRAFSRRSFEILLRTPGITVLIATQDEVIVGAQLWLMHEQVAYGHVLAFSDLGYKLGASYALYWFALEHFADKVRYCDFAGVSGMSDEDQSGLAWFKSGWSTEKRTAYFCSSILNRARYDELVNCKDLSGNAFFPAYREGF